MIPFTLITFGETMHKMWNVIKDMDPMTIFKYYTLACMIFFPFICLYLVYLYKHTNVLKKIDAFFELKLDGKPGPAAERLAEAEKKDKLPEEDAETEQNEEEGTELPIPVLNLRVGDKYLCQLSDLEQKEVGNIIEWESSNPFVASIPENDGLLKANHEGVCDMMIGDYSIYKVIVEARNRKGYLGQDIKDLFNFGLIDQIKARLPFHLKIKNMDFQKGITEFVGDGLKVKNMTYQSDKKGRVIRFVYEVIKDDENWKEILTQMSDRMTEIEDKDNTRPQRKYWYHLGYAEDDKTQEELYADFVAFMKISSKGDILLGVGKSWRFGGSEDEIKNNLEMIERSFADCLDDEELPGQVGSCINEDDYKDKEPEEKKEPASGETREEPIDPTEGKTSEEDINPEYSEEEEDIDNETPDLEEMSKAAFETDEPSEESDSSDDKGEQAEAETENNVQEKKPVKTSTDGNVPEDPFADYKEPDQPDDDNF